MKDFLKYMGATVVGLILFCIIVTAVGVMSIVGMIASTNATQKVQENTVLLVNLNGVMQEQADDNLVAQLNGTTGIGLRETLAAIRKAKSNDNIKGIFIEAGGLIADMAQLEEIRNALVDFKKSKKWIVAHGDSYSQSCYYVSSVADKIYINPQGMIDWQGIGGQVTFLKDVYAKVGIKMIPFKCGKYKSATEIYTEDKMSAENREQTERYVNGWWQTICRSVSQSRKIPVDSLNAYADRMVSLESAENLKQYKMVDALLYDDQVKSTVKKMLRVAEDETVNQISVAGMQNVPEENEGDEIAVYYAYGDIVDEEMPQSMLFSAHMIVGKDVCRDLADLADDDEVKAVVIRVNSGGGSAYASEQLWHQIELLKKKKPVVISMGGAAASGGYYMSAAANYIVAEPTTITGSIGIYSVLCDRSELMTQKLGFKYDEVKTNRNSTMGSEVVPMSAEQMRYMQGYIDRGYRLFKSRVAQGRNMSMEKVEAIAQGHVYLGSDAIKLGLVDALGGLDVAVAKAAQLAKTESYYTADYPGTVSILDQLLEDGESRYNSILDDKLKATLGDFYQPFLLMQTASFHDGLQARMPMMITVQ